MRGNQNLRLFLELGKEPLVSENCQNPQPMASFYSRIYVDLHLLPRVRITELFGEGTKALLHHLPNLTPYLHGIIITLATQRQGNNSELRRSHEEGESFNGE